jgi:ribosomal protein L9
MAIEVTEATIAEKKQKEKKAQDNARMLKEQVYTIREALHTKELTFKMAGKGTKIFGGISEKDIVAQIEKVYGIHLEKSMIDLPEGHHLKNAGDVEIHINLGKGIFTKMKVYVEVAG